MVIFLTLDISGDKAMGRQGINADEMKRIGLPSSGAPRPP